MSLLRRSAHAGEVNVQRTPELMRFVGRLERHYARVRPYLLSEEALEKRGRVGTAEYMYGDTPPRVLLDILDRADIRPDDRFVDLGCGAGSCVLLASRLCAHAIGVDAISELVAAAEHSALTLSCDNTTFECGEHTCFDWSRATILYCYATCVPDQKMALLSAHAARCAPGTRVVTVTQELCRTAGLELFRSEERVFATLQLDRSDRDPCEQSLVHTVHYYRKLSSC